MTDLWRCTVCGQVSTVGRCCGEETREPWRPIRRKDEEETRRIEAVADRAEQLEAEIERMRAEVERVTCELMDATTRADKLAEALREARDAIEDWAGYASDYFREKHDLSGDLAKIDALLRDQEGGLSND